MKNKVVTLTPEQQENIQNYISQNFGDAGGFIAHEIESEFVHTDVLIIAPEDSTKTYVTFGMSAIPTASPLKEFERTELVISASKDFGTMSSDGMLLAQELTNKSKYPFRYDSWFGAGHTIDVSEGIKEKFGFDYFAFWDLGMHENIKGIGTVSFLALVPVYSDEYEWIVENNTAIYLELLYEKFGDKIFNIDMPREHFIPEEDGNTTMIMKMLNIDKETYERLAEFLEDAEEIGEEINYDMIAQWIEENR